MARKKSQPAKQAKAARKRRYFLPKQGITVEARSLAGITPVLNKEKDKQDGNR
ncbi:MAG: hypothetical protein WA991_03935 [Ornithinimicrobium sp.]